MQTDLCPWVSYHGAYPYDFPICEQSLCSWIRQPANTWSNLVMLFVGVYLVRRGKGDQSDTDFYLGASIFIMGICSFICHATAIPLFVFLDVTSIFLFLSLLSVLMLVRGNAVRSNYGLISTLGFFLISLGFQFFISKAQILILMLFIALLVISEVAFLQKIKIPINHRSLFWALILLFIAATSLGFDYTKTSCFPKQHLFQFHALWHILSGFSMLFIANYMKQFSINFRRFNLS
jgi:hypothetical protein